ncbi:MAG: hypothetical protein JKY42_03090 [Flavobacteriales bacterium]|nr:hypothetical protein [Flavobacteriales bacterium]
MSICLKKVISEPVVDSNVEIIDLVQEDESTINGTTSQMIYVSNVKHEGIANKIYGVIQ